MGISVMVMGKSGRGKSTSIGYLNPDEVFAIKPINKPFPFRPKGWKKFDPETKEGNWMATDNYDQILGVIQYIKDFGKNIVVIDDAQYLMANEFMRRAGERGFDKFTEIGEHFWNMVMTANDVAPDDVRIYFLMHTEESDNGQVKAKTIGKLLDEKITVEGMFTVVLKADMNADGKYKFYTQNNGKDTCKSPIGMFEDMEIDNNLQVVDDKIVDYYEIAK